MTPKQREKLYTYLFKAVPKDNRGAVLLIVDVLDDHRRQAKPILRHVAEILKWLYAKKGEGS